ncbi:MAG TPA: site-specific integrase [Archangium sp.]|uniref:tyrosine-type recombinase/integrase n=1 Tax=Archangium sp. TaxID=1872627 RepID=UPI002E332848|nr:site-specific integrase [Archangium sp.]HEX5750004.1 site-specific integrase [Archangium sp.]
MTSAYFRPNKKGKAVLAAGKRLQRRAPDFGTWWIRYRDAAGRLVRERTSARMEAEAERMAQEKALHAERVASGLAAPAPVPMTCEELFTRYLDANKHLGSQAPMRSQVKVWLVPHFKRKPVAAVTPADCDALLMKSRDAGQEPATVRQLHIRARLVFKYAVQLGAIRENPWDRVPRPKVSVKTPRFLSREQVAALLQAAGQYRLLLLTAVLTGMRRGELAALAWGDIHWDEGPLGLIHVRRSWKRDTTKGGKERIIPLHPALRAELEAAFRALPRDGQGALVEPLVFASPEGGLRNEGWHTAKLVRRIAARAGVELPRGFTFHDLRKTFLTHLLADTLGNLGAGQQLAGHSTPAVTSTYYLGRNIDFLSQAVESLRLVEPASAPEHKASTRRLKLVSNAAGSTRKGQQ